jgi:P-type E1-E2 ATPase
MAGVTWLITGKVEPAVAVLVAATPCPLILAVPIAIIAGISNAAKRGAVIKDGAALERIATSKVLLVDKTGTLTHGGPAVTGVQTAKNLDADTLLRWAASLEQSSAHVLARAVIAEAGRRNLELLPAESVREIFGEGLEGLVAGRDLIVGRMPNNPPAWVEVKNNPQIAVFVDQKLEAVIDLDDPIRPDAALTISRLRKLGVSRIVLVTGDRKPAADAIGAAVGVDAVFAECRPETKLQILADEKKSSGAKVMVVGDGINDAPALAAADAGVAMGARGATAASESASVVIVEDSISRLADAIEVAKGANRRALQAAAIGMSLSLIAMVVGAFGLATPTQNAIAQELIDAAAILWALVPARILVTDAFGKPAGRL